MPAHQLELQTLDYRKKRLRLIRHFGQINPFKEILFNGRVWTFLELRPEIFNNTEIGKTFIRQTTEEFL